MFSIKENFRNNMRKLNFFYHMRNCGNNIIKFNEDKKKRDTLIQEILKKTEEEGKN